MPMRHFFKISLFAILTAPLMACSGLSRTQSAPVMIVPLTDSLEFIEQWYTCGPFPRAGSPELRRHWAAPADPSAPMDSQALPRQSYETKNGPAGWVPRRLVDTQMLSQDPVTKKIRPLDVRIIDFLKEYPKTSVESSAYALAFVQANSPQTRTVLVGSDDGVTIWLNGEQIHRIDRERPLVPDEDFVIARFRPGLNVLLVEVTNARGYWGFMLRIHAVGSAAAPEPLPVDLFVK